LADGFGVLSFMSLLLVFELVLVLALVVTDLHSMFDVSFACL